MHSPDTSTVTMLLHAAQDGDRDAIERLFPLVYEELHRKAHLQRSGNEGMASMNTTAIVHEAYLKLAGQDSGPGTGRWENRVHFYAVAAKAMRHVYLDYAKRKRRQKRGGDAPHVALDASRIQAPDDLMDDATAERVLELNEALDRLAETNPRQARIVECRFFGGLSVEETAAVTGTSAATVKRDWALAKARLFTSLTAGGDDER